MISMATAVVKATEYVRALSPRTLASENDELLLQTPPIAEFPDGWVFGVMSRMYSETGDPDFDLVGQGPVFVWRSSGEVVQLPVFWEPQAGESRPRGLRRST